MLSVINMRNCDVVMLHSLFLPYNIVLQIKKTIIWSTWGNDIYCDTDDPLKKIFSMDLYKPQTRLLLQKAHHSDYKNRILFALWKMLLLRRKRQKEYIEIAQKTAFFSTVLPTEFQSIKEKYSQARYCPFHYYDPRPKGYTPPPLVTSQFISNRVLLGNSNDPTNNHYDILEKLNSLGMPLEIIVPFSYPNNCPAYNSLLTKKVTCFKNLKIRFIKDFLDANEYYRLVDSCSVAFFGHLRQQAVGNISVCLNTGKKVFLYEDSICYSHFRNLGCTLYSIDKDLNNDAFANSLPRNVQEMNRELLLKQKDYDEFIKKLQGFFDDLEKERKACLL